MIEIFFGNIARAVVRGKTSSRTSLASVSWMAVGSAHFENNIKGASTLLNLKRFPF